jgi:hypothetical protein
MIHILVVYSRVALKGFRLHLLSYFRLHLLLLAQIRALHNQQDHESVFAVVSQVIRCSQYLHSDMNISSH